MPSDPDYISRDLVNDLLAIGWNRRTLALTQQEMSPEDFRQEVVEQKFINERRLFLKSFIDGATVESKCSCEKKRAMTSMCKNVVVNSLPLSLVILFLDILFFSQPRAVKHLFLYLIASLPSLPKMSNIWFLPLMSFRGLICSSA